MQLTAIIVPQSIVVCTHGKVFPLRELSNLLRRVRFEGCDAKLPVVRASSHTPPNNFRWQFEAGDGPNANTALIS